MSFIWPKFEIMIGDNIAQEIVLEDMLHNQLRRKLWDEVMLDIDVVEAMFLDMDENDVVVYRWLLEEEQFDKLWQYIIENRELYMQKKRLLYPSKHLSELIKPFPTQWNLVEVLESPDDEKLRLLFALLPADYKSYTELEIHNVATMNEYFKYYLWYTDATAHFLEKRITQCVYEPNKPFYLTLWASSTWVRLWIRNPKEQFVEQIYEHRLVTQETRAMWYHIIKLFCNNETPFSLFGISESTIDTLLWNDMIYYNVSKEKTYIRDEQDFVKKCQYVWVPMREIEMMLSDSDTQQYIASQEAYFSVAYDQQKQSIRIHLFDYKNDELLFPIKESYLQTNPQETLRLLHYFQLDNQPCFETQKQRSFSLDEEF